MSRLPKQLSTKTGEAQSREPLISGDWLFTETHSALGMKLRLAGFDHAMHRAAQALGLKPELD